MAEGLARFFSKNLYAFMGALTIFAVPIIKLILPSMDAWTAKTVEAAISHKAAYTEMKGDLSSYQATLAKAKAGAGVNRGLFEGQAKKMGLSTSGRGKAAAIKHFEMETTKIIANENYKRTGVLKNATTQQVAILKKSYGRMMADTKGTTTWINRQFQTMGLQFKVVTTGMKTMWAGTMAFMKTTASKVGKFMNKALGILMIFSMLVMIWDMIKPLLGMEDKENPHADAIEAAKTLNKELSLMADRFGKKIGGTGDTLKDGIDLLTFKGNMATSANLKGRMDKYFETDDDGKAALLPGIQKTITDLSMVAPAFGAVGDQIARTGSISTATKNKILELSDGLLNGKMAAQQLKDALSELQKAENTYITGKAKLGFETLITPALIGAEGARQSATELRSGNADQKAELAAMEKKILSDPYLQGSDKQKMKDAREGKSITGGKYQRLNDILLAQEPKALKMDAKANELEAYAQKYIGFATQKLGFDRQSMDLDIASHAAMAGRTDAFVGQAKKEIAWKKKGLAIDKQRVDLKIAEDLKSDITDKTSAKYLAAEQMVKNEEKKLALYIEQEEALRKLKDPLMQIETAALNAFGAGLEAAMMGVIDGTKTMKEGFLDMAKAILTAIAQIIVKLIAMKAIQAMGFGFADGGVIPMASGGYTGNKKPKGYRSGGVVTEPTYLVGEGRYNEAVVPLPDGRSIPVIMKGGSGGNANVTVNIAADGNTTESMTSNGGEQGAQLGRAVSAAVQEELHKQQRPGGILSPYGG